MKVRNNYNECLTNLACSIRKYFDLPYSHNTLEYVDNLLKKKKPKNVVCILFDGMGSNIMDRVLNKDDFFIEKRFKNITTVFPATTTAVTTSMRTGLNPSEHGWLGWTTYIEPINKIITLFRNTESSTEEFCPEFLEVKHLLVNNSIVDDINELGKDKGIELFPFGDNCYVGLDDMISRIEKECLESGKKYIYAYDDEPDFSMHEVGPDDEKVKELIKSRSNKIKEMCEKLEDTLVLIVADHGHIVTDYLYLDEYPDILEMLERPTSLEQRTVSFKIRPGFEEKFVSRFNEVFGKYFSLYSAEEVVDSELFGPGKENILFKAALGDYIAICEDNNMCLGFSGRTQFYSNHAGYTDDEIYVPLIIIDKCK